jgi:predicted nucleotidyltransferase
MVARVPIPSDRLTDFCRKWQVQELSLFGSVLRTDFRPDSDVDILVVFQPGVSHQIEAWIEMEDELKAMFGREIDLVERRLIVNPFRRHHILTNRQVLYAA